MPELHKLTVGELCSALQLPHAAGGDLGATRAGALLFAMDAVRAAGLSGHT